jgi:hypothetical protein
VGYGAGFGYPLWAIAKDLVKRYGPWRRIWLCAMGLSAKPITDLDMQQNKMLPIINFSGKQ